MSEFEVDIQGLAQTQRALYDFSERLGDRVTVLALRAGARFMLKKIREAEPHRTGRLKRATVIRNSSLDRRRVNGKVGLYITVKSKSRTDPRSAVYGQFLEKGFKRKNGVVVPGLHFVTATFETHKQQALNDILTAIEQGGRILASEIENRT